MVRRAADKPVTDRERVIRIVWSLHGSSETRVARPTDDRLVFRAWEAQGLPCGSQTRGNADRGELQGVPDDAPVQHS